MAIAFVAAADGGNNSGGSGSLTYAYTCGAGANRLLCVGVVGDSVGGNDDVTGVTYNSVAMTFVAKTTTGERYSYFYYLLNPASGANNVVISASSTHYLLSGAADYTGVKQSAQPDNSTTQVSAAAATTLTTSLTTVADNSWTVLFEQGYDGQIGAPGAGAGSTFRVSNTIQDWGLFDSNAAITPAASYSMTTTRASAVNKIGHIVVSFAPLAATDTLFAQAWM